MPLKWSEVLEQDLETVAALVFFEPTMDCVPGGGLPSACLPSSSSLDRGKASISIVTFGARSLGSTMTLVGPMVRGKPGLMRGPWVWPGLYLTVPGAGWSELVL